MSTFSHSLDRVRVEQPLPPRTNVDVTADRTTEESIASLDNDGLGALRGLLSAMLFNLAIALFVAGACELSRLFR